MPIMFHTITMAAVDLRIARDHDFGCGDGLNVPFEGIVIIGLIGGAALAFRALHAVAQDAGTRLSKEELLALLPRTKVSHVAPSSGSLRTGTNEPDGHFVASTETKGYIGNAVGTGDSTARGSWLVNDQGK